MSSPAAVLDPAWFGNQCCVKYTSKSSGVAVSNDLLHVALACSQSASSLTAVVLAFLVLSFTDFCCRLAASVRPLLYRSRHCWAPSCAAVGSGVMLVANALATNKDNVAAAH